MARKPGDSAAKADEIRSWLADRLDRDPLLPRSVLLEELRSTFALSRSRSYALIDEAHKTRHLTRQQSSDWQVIQEDRRQYLLSLREETEQTLYLAKQEGNRSAQAGLITRLMKLDEKIAAVAPLETFRSQLEHRMAGETLPF